MEKQVNRTTDDLISRQAAIDALNCNVQIRGEENAEAVKKMLSRFYENIMAIPSAQRTGKWIYSNDFHWYVASCNKCGYQRRTDIKTEGWNQWKYCPNCGARMVEE